VSVLIFVEFRIMLGLNKVDNWLITEAFWFLKDAGTHARPLLYFIISQLLGQLKVQFILR
jgi:hypothetical protein